MVPSVPSSRGAHPWSSNKKKTYFLFISLSVGCALPISQPKLPLELSSTPSLYRVLPGRLWNPCPSWNYLKKKTFLKGQQINPCLHTALPEQLSLGIPDSSHILLPLTPLPQTQLCSPALMSTTSVTCELRSLHLIDTLLGHFSF